MKNTTLRYGIYAGLVLVALSIISTSFMYQLGYTMAEVLGYAGILIALSFIFFGLRHYRDVQNAGHLKFGEGLKLGTLITLLPSTFMFVWSILFFAIWGDEFQVWADAHYQESMSSAEYVAYQEQLTQMGNLYTNPFFQGLIMFLTVFILGFIVTIISTLILQKKA